MSDQGRQVPPHGSGGQVLPPSEPATHVTIEVAAHEIATWMERATKAEALRDDLTAALWGLLNQYVELVNSGDAGNWNPEAQIVVKDARAALSKAEGR